MYSREVAGQTLTLGVSGKLIRNVLVMFDRETDTLWPQLTGVGLEGELKGETLEFLPSIHTTWGEWRELHPDTVALVKGYRGNVDNYESYYLSGQTGVIAETYDDERLYTKEYVIGVQLGADQVAYPYRILNEEPVVNDQIGERDVLVVFSIDSGAGAVFDRSIDGHVLEFADNGDGTLTDTQTGSTWSKLSGLATNGQLAGTQLEAIKSTRSFWFGWKDWFPDSRVYGVN